MSPVFAYDLLIARSYQPTGRCGTGPLLTLFLVPGTSSIIVVG